MHTRKISQILDNISIKEFKNPNDPEINGIVYDSRSVKKGNLFVALSGVHTDGKEYIADAVNRGAAAVMHEGDLPQYLDGITYIQVINARTAFSKIANNFYRNPSEKLIIIGVTGTDGKSTTVWLLDQLFTLAGYNSGFLSTVQIKTRDTIVSNPYRQSTPEASEVQKIIYEMAEAGKKVAVIESTSHGLSEKTGRLNDVLFDAAILTNVTHEHLEFHGSFEQYRHDKANLFRALSKHHKQKLPFKFGILKRDDPNFNYFAENTEQKLLTYSLKNDKADLYAYDIKASIKGSRFSIKYGDSTVSVFLPLPGLYNIENFCASALAVLQITGININRLPDMTAGLQGVKGRMTQIDCGQPFTVIVDYAHTPFSFEQVFSMARPLTKGRLISVFGSAGERDVQKRRLQGAIASQNCDIVILTDEDPRLEDRVKILEEIAGGCRTLSRGSTLFLEPDRKKAIALAYSLARKNDSIMLLGKGHEQSIIYPEGPMAWDETEVATSLLREIGYKKKGPQPK
ncbi:MAG: UDP-N-acetylmuramoyl-L-alanyl-D-glutamate--2,6-diaminopimelate ligase [Spirochaetales bacterium]|nr:UDP-N-acetylmuramoyl-L-alanyl-D-glutamate--2,6-diaminopimelate ligase [Spirochaetales bacterium]